MYPHHERPDVYPPQCRTPAPLATPGAIDAGPRLRLSAAPLPPARSEAAAITPLLQQVLDALGCGLVLVDAQGQVLHANAAAVQQCRDGAPLVLPATGQPVDGVAAALPAGDAARLAQALHGAVRGHWAMVVLDRGDRALSVGVAPIGVEAADWPGRPPVALLMLGAEPHAVRLSRQFFDMAHQLTERERGVLDALCDGCTPQQIASQREVKISTVRTQIAAIREKVGVSSIRRLIQRVAALPPMAGLGRLRVN